MECYTVKTDIIRYYLQLNFKAFHYDNMQAFNSLLLDSCHFTTLPSSSCSHSMNSFDSHYLSLSTSSLDSILYLLTTYIFYYKVSLLLNLVINNT